MSDALLQRPQVHGFTPDGFVQAARELVPRGFGAARDLYKQAVREGRFEPASLGLSAEAVAHYHAALQRFRNGLERELDQRWARNTMLNKWLEYCAERGHRFPQAKARP